MLYNQEINIYRIGGSASTTNPFSTTKKTEQPITTIKGRISRKSTIVSSDGVNKVAIGSFRLYCDVDSDVIKGDRVQDEEGTNYLVDFVYKPNKHHLEADLTLVRKDT